MDYSDAGPSQKNWGGGALHIKRVNPRFKGINDMISILMNFDTG